MAQYLVELYLSRVPAGGGAKRAAAAELVEGLPVRHLRTIILPGDETCLHLFEAPSAEAVRVACRRAGIRFDRLVEAAEIPSNRGRGSTNREEKQCAGSS